MALELGYCGFLIPVVIHSFVLEEGPAFLKIGISSQFLNKLKISAYRVETQELKSSTETSGEVWKLYL